MTDARPTHCLHCGAALQQPTTGRPRHYCDVDCRWAAWRERHGQAPSVEQVSEAPQPVGVPEGIDPQAGWPRRGQGRPAGPTRPRFAKAIVQAGDHRPG